MAPRASVAAAIVCSSRPSLSSSLLHHAPKVTDCRLSVTPSSLALDPVSSRAAMVKVAAGPAQNTSAMWSMGHRESFVPSGPSPSSSPVARRRGRDGEGCIGRRINEDVDDSPTEPKRLGNLGRRADGPDDFHPSSGGRTQGRKLQADPPRTCIAALSHLEAKAAKQTTIKTPEINTKPADLRDWRRGVD
uniref:Uncharacterized protein n=1 Tax=Oryza glumipatula TaxID=40148 RepID=A0A0D9Z7D9_9ORYZ